MSFYSQENFEKDAERIKARVKTHLHEGKYNYDNGSFIALGLALQVSKFMLLQPLSESQSVSKSLSKQLAFLRTGVNCNHKFKEAEVPKLHKRLSLILGLAKQRMQNHEKLSLSDLERVNYAVKVLETALHSGNPEVLASSFDTQMKYLKAKAQKDSRSHKVLVIKKEREFLISERLDIDSTVVRDSFKEKPSAETSRVRSRSVGANVIDKSPIIEVNHSRASEASIHMKPSKIKNPFIRFLRWIFGCFCGSKQESVSVAPVPQAPRKFSVSKGVLGAVSVASSSGSSVSLKLHGSSVSPPYSTATACREVHARRSINGYEWTDVRSLAPHRA